MPKIGYAQIITAIFAVFLFYVITFWGITPKTVLVLYITFSTLYILVWRTVILPKFVKGLPKEECVLISKELEGTELYSALSKETPYPLHISKVLFVSDLVTQQTIKNFIQKSKSN